MNIFSTAFNYGEEIPDQYTCNGENIIPPLHINEVPENTQTLALIVDDPDAPSGLFTHWIVWNLDKDIKEIGADHSISQNAVEGKTSWGGIGYKGPCPPSGTHRYFFKLFALDAVLNIPLNSKIEDTKIVFDKHKIDYAEYMGVYSKK